MTRGDWYVVQTNPQCERKAAAELRRAGLRVYMPKRQIEFQHNRTKAPAVKRVAVLVGYLFIRFPDERVDGRGVPHFAIARACQGVRDLVRAINDADEWEPWPVPNRIVASLMNRERHHEFDDQKLQAWFKAERRARFAQLVTPGASVRVVEGPFASFEAVIERLNHDNSVRALVSIMGRETAVTFGDPERELEPIAKSLEAA